MLIVNKLRFKNIGRFVTQQEIDLGSLGSLIQVDAKRLDAEGSSGSGKSTIFNAIDFLFGFNYIPNSMLQSRLTEDSIFVEADCSLDGIPIIISRGKKLKITWNSEVTTGSSKITEEKLDQVFKISRHLFRPMMHKRQGERGFFLSMSPAEMNSFLTDCLGLSEYKKHIADLEVCQVDLSKSIGETTVSLENADAALKATIEAKAALGGPPIREVGQDTILELKAKLDGLIVKLNILRESHAKEEEAFVEQNTPRFVESTYTSDKIDQLDKNIREWQERFAKLKLDQQEKEHTLKAEISSLNSRKINLNSDIEAGKRAKQEAEKLASEVLQIRKNMCPRCNQSWITDRLKEEEMGLLFRIEELKMTIDVGKRAVTKLDDVLGALSRNENSLIDLQTSLTVKESKKEGDDIYNKLMAEKQKKFDQEKVQIRIREEQRIKFAESLKELKSKHSKESMLLAGQVDMARRVLDVSVNKFKNHTDNVSRYESSLKKLEDQEALYLNQYSDLKKKIENYSESLAYKEELKRAIKSFLSCSFDDALSIISENATKMIRNIPNMANATIQLVGIKETKDGKVKEEVNAILHMDGEDNVPIKTLSGGERASVDIAIDLSVLTMLEEESNTGCNLYILDEPFDGLDSTNVEMVLEVLKNSHINKKLIIVSHDSVVKEYVSDRIIVVRDGLTSTIEPRI